jgi:hypothetical protein
MKIRVKHKEIEFVVEDDGLRTDTNYGLIYYNHEYILNLLKAMTENIMNIIEKENQIIDEMERKTNEQ